MDRPETNRIPGSPAEVMIEKLVYGGRGLGRLEGLAVFVPYVLPGEVVRIEPKRERPGLIEAKLARIVSSVSERVKPPCPYFGRCGGCHYQHAGYENQLVQKIAVLREVLRRVGKFEGPEQISVISGSPWEYRNRAQFHLSSGKIGYLETASNRLCAIERCRICSPRISETLAVLLEMIRDRRFPRFVNSIELFTNENEVQVNIREAERPVARSFFDWCAERIPGANTGTLEYLAAGEILRVGHRSFFQVNRFLIEQLVLAGLEDAQGETAVDLYAGVGLFSLPLARRFRCVTAVESGASAVNDLEFNADRAGLTLEARRTTASLFLEGLERAPDFLLADPPRAGLGKSVVRSLTRLRPRLLTIISCDPATLARDLAPLLAAGYGIEKFTLIDLFPQTYHIETVTRLRLDVPQ